METKKTEVTKVEQQTKTPAERFTNLVMKEFVGSSQDYQVTAFQKRLIQNYFIKTDQTLKTAEQRRLSKTKNQDLVPVSWENINIQKLAVDVMSFSTVGLDAMQNNHINLIPFKNNSTGKYDITFIIGYKGLELKALKYGLNIPEDVVVELVYTNDKFKQIKKDLNNKIESYTFEVVDDFNRGEVVGGFYYHSFENPVKNKLKVFSLKDIEKRKPKFADSSFWGGKDYNGNEVDGWKHEMMLKTIYRSAYNDITIDSEKIDDHLISVIENDSHDTLQITTEDQVFQEVKENANATLIDFEEPTKIDNPESKELFDSEVKEDKKIKPSADF